MLCECQAFDHAVCECQAFDHAVCECQAFDHAVITLMFCMRWPASPRMHCCWARTVVELSSFISCGHVHFQSPDSSEPSVSDGSLESRD